MKYTFLWILALVATFASAQQMDSLAIMQVDSLILVSRDLTAKGEFDQALEVNAAAEKLALEKYGRESAVYSNCYLNRGRVYYYKHDYAEAEKCFREVLAISEKVLGKDHPYYLKSLTSLGTIYCDLGQYANAEPLLEESKNIRENIFGKDHFEYLMGLHPLLVLHKSLGNLGKAEHLCLQMLEISEKVFGKESTYYASILIDLGILYGKMGLFEKAEPFFHQSIALQDRLLEKDDSFYNWSMNSLALLYWQMGKYENAETVHLEIIARQVIIYGKNHPDYIRSLGYLATLYDDMGLHEKAQLLNIEAKSFFENSLNTTNPDYAGILMSLATSYSRFANYEQAEQLYLESKAILEMLSGKEHLLYSNILNNLAILYTYTGHYDKAEMLYLESKSLIENKSEMEPTSYAHVLNNLANLYRDLGNFKEAEPLYLESISVYEKLQLQEHPDYANCLKNMADWYAISNKLSKAEPLYLESKNILKKAVGTSHINYGNVIGDLATLYFKMEQFDKAENYFHEIASINRLQLEKASRYLSENELRSFLNLFMLQQNRILSFTHKTGNNNSVKICYNNSLFYKGFLLHGSNQLKRLALSDSTTTEKFNLLKSYGRRLAAEYSKLIIERDSAMIVQLEEKANVLEKDLIRTVMGFDNATRQVNWQEVQSALTPGEMAIELVHFRIHQKEQTDSTFYAALVILPERDQPLFIPLFEEKELDHLLSADKERKADYVNELYAWADRGMVKLGSAKKSLYELIWAKIEAAGLEGIKTVYYSPSGVLHRLNLGAISVDDETILSDRYNLIALNSTRQLVIPSSVTTQVNDALLVGGVNFEMDSIQTTLEDQPLLASRSAADEWTESVTRGGSWSYLKWTDREVERISTTLTTSGFKTSQLTGSEASEEVLKAVDAEGSSPRILHIATHGFFFPDPEQAPTSRSGLGEAEPVFKSSDNPMIRSGLILAGGNYAWQHGRAVSPDKEDGILTAYEISQMNLTNTELVVLSACETGLGDIQGNEGVYGLQRAFKIAGAKYLIMSLWQVPDRETMEFMTTFYRNWLEENMTIPDAFRKTQGEMRDRFINPYSWAGFVLVE